MIIRKPYAFLIKNFKKIHIFLLVFSIYVAYRVIDVSSFVNEFMNLGTYDLFKDPITNHITWVLNVFILLLILGNIAILFLLNHKKKPWKLYLVPIIEYFALFLVFSMIKSFFKSYTADVKVQDLRLARDLLMIFLIAQLPVIGIYVMRVFGLDIKKFNFNMDQEFLELSEEDREEFEIGIDIDKDTFKRGYKRFIRHIKYFYEEHKGICRGILVFLIVIGGFIIYKNVFITHKSYKEGELYYVNGYTFRVNNAYFTDKDYKGDVITDKSNFVVIDLTIKNNSAPRTVYLENFHIKNGDKDYVTTTKVYAKEFQDLGNTYEVTREVKRNEELNCIVVYRVDKKLDKNRFVLYYQEDSGYLRKIKLKIKDLSNISEPISLNLGDEFDLNLKNKNDTIIFDDYEIDSSFDYTIRKCKTTGCEITKRKIDAGEGNKILKIDFASELWESKNMIDFLTQYGKLIYKDSNDVEGTIEIKNPISKTYYGKTVFLKVPVELENAKELSIDLIVRDKHFVYKIF
ncbi:MAG: DUF4352 domain-containing protein [Bacilli bacterium]|nr:DUF4352 domain-containing protein [Bacilli bacterium]